MNSTEVFLRLNRLFEGVTGATLQFHATDMLSTEKWSTDDLNRLKANRIDSPTPSRMIESRNSENLGFPIFREQKWIGLVVFQNPGETQIVRHIALADLLTTIFEWSLQGAERASTLKVIEQNLLQVVHHPKVIPLRPLELKPLEQALNSRKPESERSSSSPHPWGQSASILTPLLIQAKSDFPMHRLALEIHHTTQRWAFISTTDLPSEIFESKESLTKLGPLTLFVPDLKDLTVSQQIRLAEYLAIQPSDKSPHVIASLPERENDDRPLLGNLLSLFCKARITWDQETSGDITPEFIQAHVSQLLDQLRQSHQVGSNLIPFHLKYLDPDPSIVH